MSDKIHLTMTGYHAGTRFCSSKDDGRNVHGAYAPLHKPEFREQVCPDCLKVWANEAYDDHDEMPEWVRQLRAPQVTS